MQKVDLNNSTSCTTDTLKKLMLRDRTDRAWFSRLLRHPARKRNRSILTTQEPARGGCSRPIVFEFGLDSIFFLNLHLQMPLLCCGVGSFGVGSFGVESFYKFTS